MLKLVQVTSRDHRWVLDVEGSTGDVTWSQVSSWRWSRYRWRHVITGEFLMLKAVQVTSRDHRWVLDVEASTGDVTWSQVSSWRWSRYRWRHVITGEFLTLKPVQVMSRDHRWVLDVEASTGDVTWSQVSSWRWSQYIVTWSQVSSWCWSQYRWRYVITGEFLTLKPVQVTSRDHRWVLDVEDSTGDLTWSQVSSWRWSQYRWRYVITGEFLTLKPVQVTSRVQLSEQSCSEDDDIVSFATSNAHITGPFCVFLDFLNDTTSTVSSNDDTDTVTPSSSSSRNIGTSISFIFALFSSCQTHEIRTCCVHKNSSVATLFSDIRVDYSRSRVII